jgi:pimeloyl-ACP methyl ester carboxylesterase
VDSTLLKTQFVHAPDGCRLALTEIYTKGHDPNDLNARRGKSPGPVFLLVHGFAQNKLAFTNGPLPQALLKRGARVFLGEFRGHGLSRRWSIEDTFDWGLETLLEYDLPTLVYGSCCAAQVEQIHLWGHSMGGILGYGLLSRAHRLASLTTLASPLVLGEGKPVLKVAAKISGPMLQRFLAREVPTDRLLKRISGLASTWPRSGVSGALLQLWRLGNPQSADKKKILEILQNAEPSSKRLLLDLLNIARKETAVIGRTDLSKSVRDSQLPVAAVVAKKDIFAGPKSVRKVAEGRGPRRILVLPRAAHIDLTVGDHCEQIVDELWSFLTAARD